MLDEILDYVGLDLNKENKNLSCKKSEFNITKSFDNSMLYKVYKKLSIKDIDILVGMSDRTTDIKERYNLAKPINNFIKENKDDFENLLKEAKIEDIKNIEKMQKEFDKKNPYFIKYEKNYLWQIYYSKENDKYFMLFPAREEGETAALFYLIKKKIENSDEKIYVPICKEEPSESLLKKSEMTDIENYIWLFTKEWTNIYEVEENKNNSLYIVGNTKIKEGLKSKYRIKINTKERADEEYTLLKALFILTTETHYRFSPCIDEEGNLRFEYEDEQINIKNLTEFISKQVAFQKNYAKDLEKEIKEYKKKLEKVKQDIKELNNTYLMQERQIVMFLDCKKSMIKRIKFYFKKPYKFSLAKKTIENEENIENKQTQKEPKIDSKNYTLSDLVKICKENESIRQEYNNAKADTLAMENKKKNLETKVKNAKQYLEEIEEHKKSLFEFWKFAKKDENPSLMQGEEEIKENKLDVKFDLDEDLMEFSYKADSMQRQKLSVDEENSIFACKYILNSINSIMLGKEEKEVLEKDLENLKEKYTGNKRTEIFGDIEEDYTKIKNLNNKKHRENNKNIYSILRINDKTTYEEYKNAVEDLVRLLNEAYKKITSVTDFNVYYTKEETEGYTIAEIDPKNIDLKNLKNKTIFKIHINEDDNILYFSNIIYFDNLNKTLPKGMDVTLDALIKLKEHKNKKETFVNVLEDDGGIDIYNVKINKIKVVDLYD